MSDIQQNFEYAEERLAHRDFHRAWMGAKLKRLWRSVVSSSFSSGERRETLRCYDDARLSLSERCCTATEYVTVEVERINGSVNRCTAFDSRYAPLCSCTRDRWIEVAKAYRSGTFLPPVKLYKVGENFYVYDGNHRVSVASSRGIPVIDALVKEIFYVS